MHHQRQTAEVEDYPRESIDIRSHREDILLSGDINRSYNLGNGGNEEDTPIYTTKGKGNVAKGNMKGKKVSKNAQQPGAKSNSCEQACTVF